MNKSKNPFNTNYEKNYEVTVKYVFDHTIDIDATEEEVRESVLENLLMEFSEDAMGFYEKLKVSIDRVIIKDKK